MSQNIETISIKDIPEPTISLPINIMPSIIEEIVIPVNSNIQKLSDVCEPIEPIEPIEPKELIELLEPKETKEHIDPTLSIIPIVPINNETNSFLVKLEEMVSYINSVIGNEKITATNIVVITTNLMHIVEQYKDLTGFQKKMLIINTIKKVINENTSDIQERMSLMTIVELTLPALIDTLVSAINGKIKFEKDKIMSFFKKICFC